MTEALLRICRSCHTYSMRPACPKCGAATQSPHPARFSPQDRYGEYRRRLYAEESRRTSVGTR
jgi:H/ACA ribonucleoprotein complex subunit 3